jgi:hypothetical protein
MYSNPDPQWEKENVSLYQVSSKSPKGFRRRCKDNVIKGQTEGETDNSGIA